MLSKQVIIISILIPFIEYYNYAAVRKTFSKFDPKTKNIIWVVHGFLAISVILALMSFRHWAAVDWPSQILKIAVNLFLGVFFARFLIACIMAAGDVLALVRFLGLKIGRLTGTSLKKTQIPAKGISLTRSQFISNTALICGGVFFSALGFGMTNCYRYKIHYVKVPSRRKGLKGLKIVQISDIHSGSLNDKEAITRGIEEILEQRPDLILFTGDLVNYRSVEVEPFIPIFSRLTAPLGVYSVLGNHDYGDYLSWPTDKEKLSDFMNLLQYQKQMGWKVLRNEHILLPWGDEKITLIGVENWSAKHRFQKYGNLERAVAGIHKDDMTLKILMSHDPSHWDADVRPNFPEIDLTLSGHTHGMQFGVEASFVKWSPVQYLYKQWAGLYQANEQFLYVNRGFGFIGYNGRLGILPEITVLQVT